MRIYWTTTTEMIKNSPEIFVFNLKEQGMFIGVPGTLIFRTRQEAIDAISQAKEQIELERLRKEYDESVDLTDDSIPMAKELI